MPVSSSAILFAGAFAAVLGVVAVREHRLLRQSRRNLLSQCAGLLRQPRLTHGADDFPQLAGLHRGRDTRVALLPDTMTIRRLPQLWLSVTVLEARALPADLAVLVRPSGNDFYSLTHSLDCALQPPAALPWEVMARGSNRRAQALLDRLAPALADILADHQVKEVAVTAKGLRIVRQAAEGRRGEHLLLRQAIFDVEQVPAREMQALLDAIDTLATELTAPAITAPTAPMIAPAVPTGQAA